MRLDRPLAQEQGGGDLLVRATLRNEVGDTPFGCRQAFFADAASDPTELRTRLVDPGGGPELLETRERRLDRVPGGTLLPPAPPDDAEREQRASPPEGVAGGLVLRDRLLQE